MEDTEENDMKCWICNGTGKTEIPKNKEKFDKEFDRLDAPGTLTMGECRKLALKSVGYTIEKCPNCNGSGEVYK